MEKEFSFKINAQKAFQAFLFGAFPSALICMEDATRSGTVDSRKVLIGAALSACLAGGRSVQNWMKNKDVKDPNN